MRYSGQGWEIPITLTAEQAAERLRSVSDVHFREQA